MVTSEGGALSGHRGWRRSRLTAGIAVAALVLAGCAGAGGGGGGGGDGGGAINVLMVGNPQMEDIQKLTADNFTKQTGIKVNYHDPARERAARQGHPGRRHRGRPVRRGHGRRLRGADLGQERLAQGHDAVRRQGDAAFDKADLLRADGHSRCPARTASSTRLPFYGESSFLMYRKDVFDAEGPHDARAADVGRRSPTARRQGRRRRAGHARASACAACRAGASCSRR